MPVIIKLYRFIYGLLIMLLFSNIYIIVISGLYKILTIFYREGKVDRWEMLQQRSEECFDGLIEFLIVDNCTIFP